MEIPLAFHIKYKINPTQSKSDDPFTLRVLFPYNTHLAAFALAVTCTDKHWEMLGDFSYSSGKTARKKIYMNNCCFKTSTFGCSMMPQLRLCASILENNSNFFIKNEGWESINLGWGHAVSSPLIPVFCPAACSATSLLPAPQVPLCPEGKGVLLPICPCLASGLHWGRWYLVSLLILAGNSVYWAMRPRCIPLCPGGAGDFQWRAGWHPQRGWYLLLPGLAPLLGAATWEQGPLLFVAVVFWCT